MTPAPPPRLVWEPVVRAALAEDLGRAGDLTTDLVVPAETRATARVVMREPGVVAGLHIAMAAFGMVDPATVVERAAAEGERVKGGSVAAQVDGPARALLTAERVALNLFSRMCGIATQTAGLVEAVAGTGTLIADTRKTTPGLRSLEKYAVRCGGGHNHRFGLDDAVLIKDNHIAVAGGVGEAVKRIRESGHLMTAVEIEVESFEQLEEALEAGVEAILLDNMTPDEVRRAVEVTGGQAIHEASGGITPDKVAEYAKTGVDIISLGWLTHSAPALDVALEISLPG